MTASVPGSCLVTIREGQRPERRGWDREVLVEALTCGLIAVQTCRELGLILDGYGILTPLRTGHASGDELDGTLRDWRSLTGVIGPVSWEAVVRRNSGVLHLT